MVTITRLGLSGEITKPHNRNNHLTSNYNPTPEWVSNYSLDAEPNQSLLMDTSSETSSRDIKKISRRLSRIVKRISKRVRKENFKIRTKSLTTPDGFKMYLFFIIDQSKEGVITELSYKTRGGKTVSASILFGKDDSIYDFQNTEAEAAVGLYLDAIVELSRYIETEFVD